MIHLMAATRPWFRYFGFAWLATIAASGATGEPSEVKRVVTVGPTPAWVEPVTWSPPRAPSDSGVAAEVLLNDAQSNLTFNGSEYYFRQVVHLLNNEGVQQHAEQSSVFTPEYQQVTWHVLRLVRGDTVIDLLPTAQFRELQRELRLEAKVYDGRITHVTVLEDVRPGDILETAYTLRDDDPLMRGHVSSRNYVGLPYPIKRQTIVVHLPAEIEFPGLYLWIPPDTQELPEAIFRPARFRSALREFAEGPTKTYRWLAENIPPLHFDANISTQAAPYYPVLRLSSFDSWLSVAKWAEPIFASCGELPDETLALLEKWQKTLPTIEARMKAAAAFVQQDIRYFAMALGNNNIRPRALSAITASRFGDCKDKSVLLVALFRALGVAAWPALVNTSSHNILSQGGPDQFAFDHAIVAYEYGGRLCWIDATLRQPAGAVGEWALPPYRLGLVLRPLESTLTPIPPRPWGDPDMETHDRITVDETTGAGVMHTRVTIRGIQADYYRQQLESTARSETSKNWFNYIARFYRRIEEIAAPVVTDDLVRNEITLNATYRVRDLLKKENGRTVVVVHAFAVRSLLNPIETRRRYWPFGLPVDRFVRQRIEVDLPFEMPPEQHPRVVTAAGMAYRADKSLVKNRFVAVHDLAFEREYVRPAEMDLFADAVDEILEDLSSGLTKPAPPPLPAPTKG